MKKNTKYSYVAGQRFEHHGSRTYDFDGKKLPSVTTILARTKDQSFLDKWKAKVGHEQAEIIKNHSSKRGTSMHKFIETTSRASATMILARLVKRLGRWLRRLLKLD